MQSRSGSDSDGAAGTRRVCGDETGKQGTRRSGSDIDAAGGTRDRVPPARSTAAFATTIVTRRDKTTGLVARTRDRAWPGRRPLWSHDTLFQFG